MIRRCLAHCATTLKSAWAVWACIRARWIRLTRSCKAVECALRYLPAERIVLNPDCGFAPGSAARVDLEEVYEKLKNMVEAAHRLRDRYSQAPFLAVYPFLTGAIASKGCPY